MITIASIIIGFLSSIIPNIFKLLQDRNDRNHEKDMFALQMQAQQQGHMHRVEEMGIRADIAETKALYGTWKSGVRFMDGLNASVRPIIAYAFFLLYAAIKYATILSMFDHGIPLITVIPGTLDGLPWQRLPSMSVNGALWSEEDQVIFAGIIAFYFGARHMQKLRGK